MYRKFDLGSLLGHVTIYDGETTDNDVFDIADLTAYLDDQNEDSLYNLVMNKEITKAVKRAAVATSNTSISYSSLQSFATAPRKDMLRKIIQQINFQSIYTTEELRTIIKHASQSGSNAANFTQQQARDVSLFFQNRDIPAIISNSGHAEYEWAIDEAKSDGVIFPGTEFEIIVYLRYGSTQGGQQNDRYRSMFSSAKKYPDRRFLFVCDGVEAALKHSLCPKYFDNRQYSNAIWSTLKLLPRIDFETLTFES